MVVVGGEVEVGQLMFDWTVRLFDESAPNSRNRLQSNKDDCLKLAGLIMCQKLHDVTQF